MLKHLISLVFLLTALSYKPVYADNNAQILPEPKPKRILNSVKEKSESILPQKKPLFGKNKSSKKKYYITKK